MCRGLGSIELGFTHPTPEDEDGSRGRGDDVDGVQGDNGHDMLVNRKVHAGESGTVDEAELIGGGLGRAYDRAGHGVDDLVLAGGASAAARLPVLAWHISQMLIGLLEEWKA